MSIFDYDYEYNAYGTGQTGDVILIGGKYYVNIDVYRKEENDKNKTKNMPTLNIWNDYEYNQSLDKTYDLQKKSFQFLREIERDFNFLYSKITELENRPIVSDYTVRDILKEMNVAAFANEQLHQLVEEERKVYKTESVRVASASENLRLEYEETIKEIKKMSSIMLEMQVQMEHMEMPLRFKRDDNKLMMFLDGKWSESTQEYFDGISTHYNIMSQGLYLKKPFAQFKKEFLTVPPADDEIPF
jgi:hypothetical protein